METLEPTKKEPKPAVNTTTPIRVKKATSRNIRTIINKINAKSLGRKVNADDVIAKAIGLLKDQDLEEIKEATYSGEDRLELQYKAYCKENGQITKEKFLEILLQAGIPNLKSK